MNWQTHQLLAVANLLICLCIGWACICRLNTPLCKRHLLARSRYTLMLAGSAASGMQPLLWGTWPSVADVLFAGCMLAGLVINVVRWPHQAAVPMRRMEDV